MRLTATPLPLRDKDVTLPVSYLLEYQLGKLDVLPVNVNLLGKVGRKVSR